MVEEHELESVRRALAARVEGCYERLDDVASELIEVHGVPTEAVVARVRRSAGQRGDLEAAKTLGVG